MIKTRIRKNIKLLPYFYFLAAFNPTIIILWLYLAEKLGSTTLAMSCLSLRYIFSSIFEIPTGALSDIVGRRITIIIGSVCRLMSALILVLAHYFNNPYFMYVLFALFIGLFTSFLSGTDKALIHESLQSLKKKHKFHNVYSKLMSVKRVSMSIGVLIGGILANFSYLYVFYLYFAFMILMVIMSFFLVEPEIVELEKTKQTNGIKHFTEAFKTMMKNKKLKYLTIGYAIEDSLNNVAAQFRQVFFITIVPVWIIGLARSMKTITGAVSYWVSSKIIDRYGYYKSVMRMGLFSKFIMLFAIALSSIVTPFIFVLTAFLRAPYKTSFVSLTQKEFSNSQRATMDSIISMLGNLMVALFSLGIGILSDFTSPKFAITTVVLLSSLGFVFYKRVFREGL